MGLQVGWPASMASRRMVCRFQVRCGAAVDEQVRGAMTLDERANGRDDGPSARRRPPPGVSVLTLL